MFRRAEPALSSLSALPDVVLRLARGSWHVLDSNRPDGWAGRSQDVMGSLSLGEFLPGASTELLEAAIQGAHDPHPDTPLRLVCRHADGRELPVDVKLAEESEATVIAVIRQVSETARVAERELVTIICSAPEAIITWNPEGRIISWNPAAERLYSVHASEAIGSSIERIVPDVERAAFAQAQARLLGGEPVAMREVVRLREGQEVLVAESLFLVRDHGTHPRRIGSFSRDVEEVGRLRQATRILSRTSPGEESSSRPNARIREMYAAADRVARDPNATVLLLGETGVGKTHMARRIHARSGRADKPFLELNCATLEGPLLESELFGHERGAFTGAVAQKRGLVEVADGGTLLLDEVAELSLPAQAKLLSFLDDRRFRRLGGTRAIAVDVRIIAATNAHLLRAVEEQRFRKDLYYRLSVCVLELPPLRERAEEIPALAKEMVQELRGKAAPELSAESLQALARYSWPGNLRELRNVLERTLLLCEGRVLERPHLPPEIREAASVEGERLADVEQRHILKILASTGGNRSRTAEVLGIDRSTLRRKLVEMKVEA